MKSLYFILSILLFMPFNSVAVDKPLVVASASMFSDMASVIAGDLVRIETIVPIGADPHLHDPTPRDAKIVADADLILVNALSFEGWINELIENAGTRAQIVTITAGIEAIESEIYKGSTDPHAWMSAANGRIYIKNIKDALVALLPENQKQLEERFIEYEKEIIELDRYIENKILQIPESLRILITSHDAFAYYGNRYGIRLEPIVGISTEAEAQTSDIIRVSNVIREQKIPAVFIESTINPKLLEQMAKDYKIVIGGKLYADSLGDSESPASSYLKMLKHNTDSIVAGLTGQQEISTGTTNTWNSLLVYAMIGIILIGGFIYMLTKM